jgi:folate-binding protein YgfZ
MNHLPTPARWSSAVATIRLTGADVRRFLHGQSSQAIALAGPGSCLATCLISPTARMRGLALVLLDDQAADVVVLAGDAGAIHEALDRVLFPADQVALGQPQPATLVRFTGAGETPPAATASREVRWLQPGVDLGAGAEQPALLLEDGAPLPAWLEALPELTAEQAERQRIRQGFPAVPQEANDDTNPFELGLAPWVNLSKGCYVGQETLAKLATYGGVKQQLRYWQCDSTVALEPGTPLSTAAGERAGVITSSLCSGEGAEGLALVRRGALELSQLIARPGDQALDLSISTPPAFVAPPVGAGGQGAAQA